VAITFGSVLNSLCKCTHLVKHLYCTNEILIIKGMANVTEKKT